MASDTVPAAVPGPNDPAGTTPAAPQANQPRGLAGLLSAVDPARPAFDLNPTSTGGDAAVTGTSSAAYHQDAETGSQANSTKTTTGRQERSVIRAWLLAGAERWKQGGTARIKRLEMQKARHQAMQVKENRTVAVNRSGGFLGTGSGASGGGKPGGGKSLTSKTSGGSATKGPKNSSGSGGHGPKGRGPGGSGGSSGGRGGSGAGGGAGRGPSNGGTGGRGTSGNSGNGSTSAGSRGSKGASGALKSDSAGRNDKAGRGVKSGSDRQATTTTCGDGSGLEKKPGKGGSSGGSGSSTSGSGGKAGPQGSAGRPGKDAPAAKDSKTAPSGSGTKDDPKDNSKKVDLKKKPTPPQNNDSKPVQPTGKDTAAGTTNDTDKTSSKTADTTKSQAPAGKVLDTRESREAGYRDGTRAARAVAHVEAYRDGVKDGYRDTKEAADRQKEHLDQAHAQRKQQREKDQPVTGASSADYHPAPQPNTTEAPAGPQPIKVDSVDATHIALGDGAARTHISRGEVRTLAGFQKRLTAKTDTMTRIAERTKVWQAHAAAQSKEIGKLLEQAKGVKGGEKLVAALTKLDEAARVQEGNADEVIKRATRSAEASKVVSTNTETRYGGIYRAVVDSPETLPAELTYYQDLGITNG